MEFTALFLAITVVMLAAWWGSRTLALALFGAYARRRGCDLPITPPMR